MNRLRRWARRVVALVAVAGVVAAGLYVPELLRATDAFPVERVEVVGTRYLDPHAVVRAAGLDREASLFDDRDAWRAGVRTLALVEDVEVRRTFPGTVTLEVREVRPVGLVAAATLRPVDAAGRLLDLDPAGHILDVPVLSGLEIRDGRVVGESVAAVRTVASLLRRAPEIAERISQVSLHGDAIRIVFRDDRLEALLPAAASRVHLTQLRLALADLSARGELDRVRTIDVRFRDQVVVSFLGTPVSG